MVAFVKSVELIAATSGTLSGYNSFDVALTKGQDETKCVPFFTCNATSGGSDLRNNDFWAVEMVDVTGTANVRVHRNPSSTISANNISIYVVEFGSNVTVQQGSVDITTGTASDTLTTIVEANSFAVFGQYMQDGSSGTDDFNDAMIQCRFGSTTSIDFDRRASGTPDWTIHWYVVESDGTDFLTEYVTADWTTSQTGPTGHTLTTDVSDITNAFVIPSYETSETADDMRDAICNFALTATDTLTWYRNGGTPSATGTIGCWVVRSSDVTVQRFAVDLAGSTDNSQTLSPEVVLDKAVVVSSHYIGGGAWGVDGTTTGSNIEDRRNRIRVTATDTVTVTQQLSEAATGINSRLRFEVVEFELEGGATLNEETVSSSTTGVATLAHHLSLFRDIEATDTGSATLAFSRALSNLTAAATSVGTATLNRLLLLKRAFSATATGVATFIADVLASLDEITLSASATGVAVLNKLTSAFRTLSASVTGAATLARRAVLSRILSATSVGSAVLNRLLLLRRTLSAAATGVATFIDTFIGGAALNFETLSATVTGVAQQTRMFFVTLKPQSLTNAPAVDFDGAAGSGFDSAGSNTGLSDTKEASASFWIRRDSSAADIIYRAETSANMDCFAITSENIRIRYESSASDPVLTYQTASGDLPVSANWQHVCWFLNSAVPEFEIYIDGVEITDGTTTDLVLDRIIDHTSNGIALGNSAGLGGSSIFDGGLSQFAHWNRKIDWGVSSTLELVRTASGNAVILPDDGDIDSGGAADFVFNKDEATAHQNGGNADDWGAGVGTSDTTGPDAAGGGAIATMLLLLPKTLSAAATGVATLIRKLNLFRAFSATSIATATLNQLLFLKRAFDATATGVATLIDTFIGGAQLFSETISAVVTGNATLNRTLNLSRTFAATATGVAALIFRNLFSSIVFSATSIGTATLQRLLSLFRTLSATVTGSAVLNKVATFFRTIAATVTGLATLVVEELGGGINQVTLAATAIGTATMNRFASLFRTFSASVTGLATFIADDLAATLVTLSATVTGSATFDKLRTVVQTVSAAMTGVATFVVAVPFRARAFLATVTGLATEKNSPQAVILSVEAGPGHYSLIGGEDNFAEGNWELINGGDYDRINDPNATMVLGFFKVLSATVTGVATLVDAFIAGILQFTLSATATGVATISRLLLLARTFSAAVTAAATLQRLVTHLRTISASVTGVAVLSRALVLARTFAASMTGSASLALQRVFSSISIAATATGSAVLNKFMFLRRIFSATVTATAALFVFTGIVTEIILSATATGIAALVHFSDQIVRKFTGHGGMGRGDGKTRWASRRRSWTRRK